MNPPKSNADVSEWKQYEHYVATEIFIRQTAEGTRVPPRMILDQAKNFVSALKKEY